MSRWCLRAGVVLLVVGAAQGVVLLAGLGGDAAAQEDRSALVERGRELFLDSCASCHGEDARGIPGRAPTLHGAGAAAADWYVSTGRMPLTDPHDEPLRGEPAYSPRDIAALVAYAGTLGGPPVPDVDPARGDVGEGRELFTEHCAGCHQVVAAGGILTGAKAPPLDRATPTEIAEAVRIGPYVMPAFSERDLSEAELDSLIAYVQYTKDPDDAGGWGISHLGPFSEGMVTWFAAMLVLVATCVAIGRRGVRR